MESPDQVVVKAMPLSEVAEEEKVHDSLQEEIEVIQPKQKPILAARIESTTPKVESKENSKTKGDHLQNGNRLLFPVKEQFLSKKEDKLNKRMYQDIGSMCRKAVFLNEQPMRSSEILNELVYKIYTT